MKRKVRKIRAKKMLKADDLLPQNGEAYNSADFGSRYDTLDIMIELRYIS